MRVSILWPVYDENANGNMLAWCTFYACWVFRFQNSKIVILDKSIHGCTAKFNKMIKIICKNATFLAEHIKTMIKKEIMAR